MTVGYIPLGQDATVSDGGVDFKFKNNTDYPIKVSAYTSGATITVSIIGTDWEPHKKLKFQALLQLRQKYRCSFNKICICQR